MADMTTKIFETTNFGKAALKKLGRVPENFRLFQAGWNSDYTEMTVWGAEFRVAKKRANAGKLSIIVPNTKKSVRILLKR